MSHFISVDAGGTQLRAACYTQDNSLPLNIRRISTQDTDASPIQRLVSLVESIWPQDGHVSAIAFAVPGAVNPFTGVVYIAPNIPGWIDLPLREIMQSHFNVPVAVGNDANLAGLGEWRFGAGIGHHNMLYFTISTGIGGGIILDDRLVLGQNGLAGEVGHVTVDPEGPMCGCGQRGHIEAISSGPAIARWVKEQIASGVDCVLKDDPTITAREVASAARHGDSLCRAAFDRAGFWFGRTLADYLHLFNPSAVIIGGGVSRSSDLLFPPLKVSLKEHTISPKYYENLEINCAKLGDDAGLVGALALAQTLV
jgi:glucokinase